MIILIINGAENPSYKTKGYGAYFDIDNREIVLIIDLNYDRRKLIITVSDQKVSDQKVTHFWKILKILDQDSQNPTKK